MKERVARLLLLAAVTWIGGGGGLRPVILHAAAQADSDDLKIRALLQQVEQIAQAADGDAFLELLAGSADRNAANSFTAAEFARGAGRVVIQERDRQPLAGTLPGDGYSLTVDALLEYGDHGRVATWQLEVKRVGDDWRVAGETAVSSVDNLYRLALNSEKQFDGRNFTLVSEDIELTLVEGSVFVVETAQGVTGMVLLGRGEMRFHPAPETEKGQVRIYAGADIVESRFDSAFVRVGTLESHADRSVLKPRPVDPRDLRRAEQVFREESGKSFAVDLADLTRDTWSLLPGVNDFLAEVNTRRFGMLTYAQSMSEPEDITFFERRRQRNIAVYASKDKLAARGRFYTEDDQSPFDVIDYDINVTSLPDREWIDGKTVMRIRIAAPSASQLPIRLADSLVVRSVTADLFGRLFSMRVSNQNTILVNLPVAVLQGVELNVTVEYGGRLEAQAPDRESLALQRDQGAPLLDDFFMTDPEPKFLYSNRSFWYPQSTVSDYATATIQVFVPPNFSCVASGDQASDSPRVVPVAGSSLTRKSYLFSAPRPVRYLAFLVTRLSRADRWTVAFDDKPAEAAAPDAVRRLIVQRGPTFGRYDKLDLIVETNPQQTGLGRDAAERAVDIFQYYESIIGDSPYSAFDLALTDGRTPGGHSPGYFAVVTQPSPATGVTWRNDPAAFSNYPEFFLAHEIAHQWWGQAVGWRNYHEQWLSEGFAQYFAALYAQKKRGDDVFESVMRQMRKWAIDESDKGPVYLGYRIGHIKNEGRAFRAVIYNKGAAVLHMLRRLVGDEAFFRGLQRFYNESRFTKVGTDDFRQAMEAESGRSLERFFERWIYNATLPNIAFSYHIEGLRGSQEVVLHFEQTGDIFDLPVTLTLQYADRRSVRVIVPVTDRVVEMRVPLDGPLRTIEVDKSDGTLADIVRSNP